MPRGDRSHGPVALAPALVETYTLTLLVIYGMLALSLGLIWGFRRDPVLRTSGLFGLGAYTYAIAAINIGESTVPFLLGIAVPLLFAAALGAMMFYGRLSDVYLGVITLVVTLLVLPLHEFHGRARIRHRIGASRRLQRHPRVPDAQRSRRSVGLYLRGRLLLPDRGLPDPGLSARAVAARQPFGRIAMAIRENELRVELLGYDARARKTVLFAIGGAIAGLGTLFASWAEIVTPGMFARAVGRDHHLVHRRGPRHTGRLGHRRDAPPT